MSEIDRKRYAAVRTLEAMGYTYGGGEEWKPPLGGDHGWTPSQFIAALMRYEGNDDFTASVKDMQAFGTPLPVMFTAQTQPDGDVLITATIIPPSSV